MTYYVTYDVYGDGNFLHTVDDTVNAIGYEEARKIAFINADDLACDESERYEGTFDNVYVYVTVQDIYADEDINE